MGAYADLFYQTVGLTHYEASAEDLLLEQAFSMAASQDEETEINSAIMRLSCTVKCAAEKVGAVALCCSHDPDPVATESEDDNQVNIWWQGLFEIDGGELVNQNGVSKPSCNSVVTISHSDDPYTVPAWVTDVNVDDSAGAVRVYPKAVICGRKLNIKRLGTSGFRVTFDPGTPNSQTVDGKSSLDLTEAYSSVELLGGTTEWSVYGGYQYAESGTPVTAAVAITDKHHVVGIGGGRAVAESVIQEDGGKVGVKRPADVVLHVGGTLATDIIRSDIGYDINGIAPPDTAGAGTAVALAGAGAGNVDAGQHYYWIAYYTALGSTSVTTRLGPVTTTGGDGQVDITDIPIATDYRVIGRKLFRTTADGTYYNECYLLATIADNTTTDYRDNIADAGLGAANEHWREDTTTKNITRNSVPIMLASTKNTVFGYGNCATLFADLGDVGGENTVFGYLCARQTTGAGSKNVIVGYQCFNQGTNGQSNVIIGHRAGYQGNFSSSVLIGRNSGYGLNGSSNIFIGNSSGPQSGAAAECRYTTSVGNFSGQSVTTGGWYNSFYGYSTGRTSITTGDFNLLLGAFVEAPSDTAKGQLNIGNVIYGTGLYQTAAASSSPVAGSKIGIGKVPTQHQLENAGDYQQKLHTDAVSDPPTDAQLDALFGEPADVGQGATFYLDDAGGEAKTYLIISTGTKWQYLLMTTAV